MELKQEIQRKLFFCQKTKKLTKQQILYTLNLKKIGSERFEFNEKRFFIVKNIFDGIKEIKAFNLEKKLQNNFGNTAKKLSEIMKNFLLIKK